MSAYLYQDNLEMVQASLRFWTGCSDERPDACSHIGTCPVDAAKEMLAAFGPADSLSAETIEEVFETCFAPHVERPDPLITG
ncbi:hypothetical protein [Magnetospira sp. QH-2]|uniref:hypothetical protein n=1 Tax=Magnetospira sp. (strain QH-2) TaxID=1288970 RepID=UPI0011DE076C|nr:hypothetical protein [Magnetospira sp. QH-2]